MPLSDEDKSWISDQFERVKTKLLTEFHKWASPMEARQRSHTAKLRSLDLGVENFRDRVAALEHWDLTSGHKFHKRPLLPSAHVEIFRL